jgi:biopolymer transport protein ExbB
MLADLTTSFMSVFERGGVVMFPLLVLSLVAVTFAVERCWFFIKTNNPSRIARVTDVMRLLRRGELDAARQLVADDRSVYGRVVTMLLEQGATESTLIEAVESQRPRLERFMSMLSTIITAAPLLGILGTVIGIISSFEVLSDQAAATDPRMVSAGIAEALLTTAAGLIVALVVLFPYNAFRTQIDRTLSRIEAIGAAASRATAGQGRANK